MHGLNNYISNNRQKAAIQSFLMLRNAICKSYEKIEKEYSDKNNKVNNRFLVTPWLRPEGGGGKMSVMKGNVFEKVAVNISTVYGTLPQELKLQLPGGKTSSKFFATGISIIAHMQSPLIPAVHFNTRYIETDQYWFGGGGDLTPTYFDKEETQIFHKSFKDVCDKYDKSYYPKFKKNCDNYFFLKHRNEPRGVGGIFYDYLNNHNFDRDFSFINDIGNAMLQLYPKIVRAKMYLPWNKEQRHYQLVRRGRYVEFNLLYDRGTKFGLLTNGNIEAILMSLPPKAVWL